MNDIGKEVDAVIEEIVQDISREVSADFWGAGFVNANNVYGAEVTELMVYITNGVEDRGNEFSHKTWARYYYLDVQHQIKRLFGIFRGDELQDLHNYMESRR